jgi:glycosyltransferase involved in cell wall biosynthesis
VLIQAAEILHHRGIDDVRFILIGDGPEKLKLIEMATQKNLPNIDFQAGVPKTEVMDRLARADALLFHLNDMPVLRFGVSSNKLFDYMAAARPVIFACAAGNNPIAEAGSGLTIPPESPEAMANAILELKNMPLRERVSMGIAGRAYVEENHSWDRLSLRFEELLEGLVSSRGRS